MSAHQSTHRRSTVVRIALAGIAVLGVGVAATTAVWLDDVYFGADATASSFDLQGAPLGGAASCAAATGWEDVASTQSSAVAPIDISTPELGLLVPGEPVVVTFCLFDAGTLGGTLGAAPVVTLSGALFDGGFLTLADVSVALDSTSIAANGYVTGTLTVTPPTTWTEDAFNLGVSILILVEGQSV